MKPTTRTGQPDGAPNSGARSTSWPDDPAFQERLYNEFPSQVEAITDPVERRTFLKLMGASLGARRRDRLHAAAGREDRSLRAPARGARPRQAAVLRDRDDARRRRDRAAGREPRGTSDEDRRQPAHPGSLGATDVFAQAAILGLYDPDRSRTLTNIGEIRPWSAFLGAIRAALDGAAAAARAPAFASSPSRSARRRSPRRFEDLLARFPAARWHQWDPASRDERARRRELAVRRDASTRSTASSRPTSSSALDADFLGCGAGSPALRARVRRAPAAREAAGMNRLYAVESDADVDRRARRSSPAAEAERDRAARARAGRGARRRRRRSRRRRASGRRASVDRRGSQGSAGASRLEPRHRRRRSAAGRARARARDERRRSAMSGRPSSTPIRSKPHPVDQLQSLRELTADMAAGQVDLLRHPRRQSGLHRAGRSAVRRRAGQGAAPRAPQPARRRDLGAVPLADSGSALPRSVERRARLRRHRLDRPAADRAALRRPLRARSAGGDERPARAVGVRDRARILAGCELQVRRVQSRGARRGRAQTHPCRPTADPRVRSVLAALPARRRDGRTPPCRRARSRLLVRSPHSPRRPPPRPAASRSRSGPIRRSSTAGSPTTAGCRSCRSRSPS